MRSLWFLSYGLVIMVLVSFALEPWLTPLLGKASDTSRIIVMLFAVYCAVLSSALNRKP